MVKYIERFHNKKGMPEEYSNRVDLDTSLKERGMDGLYDKTNKAREQKELHQFVVKKAMEKGEKWVKNKHRMGRLFNKRDSEKI